MCSLQEQSKSESVRLSKSLNEGEINYVQDRMVRVEKCLKDHGIQSNNVPHIAVLGSGGGQRAMIGLLSCIDQLYQANLLDSILYLCGVSGSTWCMPSLYEDAAWSSKVPSVKDDLVKRLTETDVDVSELIKWLSQAVEDENFSLTDFWAATVVYGYVKKIDTTCLSDLKNMDATNPYPIYAVADQDIKKGDKTACWFELSPHEVGYSHIGAYVDTSSFRSQFEAGVLKQKTVERDMLYLQGLCSTALTDGGENVNIIKNSIWQWLKDIFKLGNEKQKEKASAEKKGKANGKGKEKETDEEKATEKGAEKEKEKEKEEKEGVPLEDMTTEVVESILQLVDCEDDEESAKLLQKIHKIICKSEKANRPEKSFAGKSKEEKHDSLAEYALDAYSTFKYVSAGSSDVTKITLKTMSLLKNWTWGTKYNFLYKCDLTEAEVPEEVLSKEHTHLEDAGLVMNSPYVAALRPDRKVKLILSFDFSAGDPFMTVTQAAEHCKQTGIPFPPVEIPEEDKMQPKDFYVFKSENTPTVIHIPLFNMVNCEGDVAKWRETYPTFRNAFNRETMDDLIRVSGMNVANNTEKIIQEILAVCK
ncbi:hypothetical protein SKAU_G00383570 [Synaphobranchus kaupii]|uniref:PLA2c domain-containing protein n=1 Tax=Synaphobranchus kaupii TaxID=118154 RepID=A0A9Q1EE65_SYNKA|nr:hypothetical protein SKAU_G00383570 [Synaphobranchus kaupii]